VKRWLYALAVLPFFMGCFSVGDASHSESSSNTQVAPKTTPTGVTIGSAPPGVATGQDTNGLSGGNNPVSTPQQGNAPTTPATSYSPVAWPNIGFHDYSGSLGSKVVALTFDDGPDGIGTGGQNNTGAVLDFLKANKLVATFFVCGNVWTKVSTDALAQATLKRIIAEGHGIGSHTFTHPYLDTIAPSALMTQFTNNLSMARSVLGTSFNFSMIRAPFGFPFETNNPNVSWVAPVVAPYGVHVGWGIDTDDWKCAQNGQDGNCILNNLAAQIKNGHSGPILMHAVYQLTVKTLPAIVQLLKSSGYTIVTVDQMLKEKYGAVASDIMAANAKAAFTSAEISAAAVSECSKNTPISVVY
jgi:peptidoglycan/xylan/chitin deacetylase (PgdA/CDA1 family)